MRVKNLDEWLNQVERLTAEYGREGITPHDLPRELSMGLWAEKPLPDGQVQTECIEMGLSTLLAAFSGPNWAHAAVPHTIAHIPGVAHFVRERPPDDVILAAYKQMMREAIARGEARRAAPGH